MDAGWYVLRSKPLREMALWQQAVSQGFDVFYPRIPAPAVNPRSRNGRSPASRTASWRSAYQAI